MPTARITERFRRAKQDGRTPLVAYLMGGDPTLEASLDAMRSLRDNGADIIELGAPFTDPMADGAQIQAAALRALAGGATLRGVLELARRFREEDADTPLILMGYANPVHAMGYDAFAAAAAAAGVDGTILVDLPPEEDGGLRAAYAPHGLSVIRLATPTTDAARMEKVADGASGFLYYVAVAGTTGAGSATPEDVANGIALARQASGLPVCVGFGIRTPEQAAAMAGVADGVVVGSAFVACAEAEAAGGLQAAGEMGALAKRLSAALSGTGKGLRRHA